MVRIDMSEYQEKYTVARCPYSVILLVHSRGKDDFRR